MELSSLQEIRAELTRLEQAQQTPQIDLSEKWRLTLRIKRLKKRLKCLNKNETIEALHNHNNDVTESMLDE